MIKARHVKGILPLGGVREQGSEIGGRGLYHPDRKNFENTPLRILKKIYSPPRRRQAPTPFFRRILKINVNLVKFRLI